MNGSRHTMILASAGSGKTYALTNRFIQLLARGARPERIVALTFTRKAAGEFFDEILNKLAAAAAAPGVAARLAAAIGEPALGPADFLHLLRAMVDAMPRLTLGTLDSFFSRIVRSFPLELGLAGDFEVLQESSARRERQRVLRSLFVAAGEPDAAQREFFEAFKRATFGLEEKALSRRLDAFLDEHAETYLSAPLAALWGDPARIWSDGNPWPHSEADRAAALQRLQAALPWDAMDIKQRARFELFLAALAEWSPGSPLPAPVEYVLKNALAIWDQLKAGRGELTVERRRVSLDPEAAGALCGVIGTIAGAELQRRMEMTRGLFAVLRGYERVYHDAVRRGGRLTFSDIQRLLLPDAGGPRLSSSETLDTRDLERRLAVDWRLDARFDHWLLDEFQDTSHGQWSVLRNLIDEAVQDPEGVRSFFYVGDVKQAIFSWREGDPRLFREIFDHYNRAEPGTISAEHLSQSWRSGPPIIAMVNRVFSDAAALRQVVPGAAADAWAAAWMDHESARPELGGYAELRRVEEEAGRFAETAKILREVDPLARGLTAAVIVQKNDTGARLAEYLRREAGMPAVAESDVTVCTDNPLGAALLAWLRAMAHPGDSLAWRHVLMTPLAGLLVAHDEATPERLTRRWLGRLHEDGFAGVLAYWVEQLEPSLSPTDAFSRERGRQLVDAARRFDELGGRDVAEFLRFAERHTVRDADAGSVIKVMTIHKSKGLGFDVVVLPDLEGKSLSQRRHGLAVRKYPDRSVAWILDPPGQALVQLDPILRAHREEEQAEAAYEALCRLYVAMTRAKRAMYLIAEPSGKSESPNFPRILSLALGETFSEGEPGWYQSLTPPTGNKPARPALAVVEGLEPGPIGHRASLTPSGTGRHAVGGRTLFGLQAARGAAFGTAVHDLFATVEWWDPGLADLWTAARRGENVDTEALAEALGCLESGRLDDVFRDVTGRAAVWRERAFEIVLDGQWVTGVFDRVVLLRDDRGAVRSVQVWDFKTDRVADRADAARAAQRYAGQLTLYRRVAARLAGVPERRVKAALVFTATGEVVQLSDGV